MNSLAKKHYIKHDFSYDEFIDCHETAIYRCEFNKYKNPKPFKERYFNELNGCIGEKLASILFGIPWRGAKLNKDEFKFWSKNCADIGFFEIKTIRNPSKPLILKENTQKWAVVISVFAKHDFRNYNNIIKIIAANTNPNLVGYVIGWGHAENCIKKGIKETRINQFSTEYCTYSIEQNLLRDPIELTQYLNILNQARLNGVYEFGNKIIPKFIIDKINPRAWSFSEEC